MALNPNTSPIDMIEVDLTECDKHDSCRICYNVDGLVCDRGRHCSGLRIGDRPAPIGYFMDGDDRGTSAYTFRFADNDEFLFCEDCAYDIRETGMEGVTDIVVEGAVGEFGWSVDIAHEKFQAFIATHGPDHGTTWEAEGGVFDTLTEALAASRGHATAMTMASDVLDHGTGRTKHPTDLAVPTTLTVDELDIVLAVTDDGDPLTVRAMLTDACRILVGDYVAELVEAGKLPPSMV